MSRSIRVLERLRAAVAIVVLGGGAGLFLAAQTSAAAATHPFEGASIPVLSLRGSNGYRIEVSGYRHRSTDRVSLTASKNDHFASYTVQGLAKDGKIRAHFPGLGKVAVRFVPNAADQRPSESARKALRSGTGNGMFVGTITFRGERHFTSVTASAAHGSIVPRASKRSRLIHRLGSYGARNWSAASSSLIGIEYLEVVSGDVHFSASYRTANGVEGKSSSFEAYAQESRQGMEILRSTSEVSSSQEGAFEHDGITSASVRPPSPFLGSGSYNRSPENKRKEEEDPEAEARGPNVPFTQSSGTFNGSLRVELPGLGIVHLGEHTAATLGDSVSAV